MTATKAKRAPAAAVVETATVTETAAKQIEQAVADAKETIETVVKVSQDAATKAANLTKDQVQVAVNAQSEAFKSYEDAVQATKEAVDALTKSGTILTKGLQDLTKAMFGLAQQTVEDTVAASKQLLAAKTLPELVDAQAALAKTSFDKLFAEGTRLSDLSVKLIEEAAAPLAERVNATVDKLVKRAA